MYKGMHVPVSVYVYCFTIYLLLYIYLNRLYSSNHILTYTHSRQLAQQRLLVFFAPGSRPLKQLQSYGSYVETSRSARPSLVFFHKRPGFLSTSRYHAFCAYSESCHVMRSIFTSTLWGMMFFRAVVPATPDRCV